MTIPDERFKCLIRNAIRIAKPKEQDCILWAFVAKLTGHGCTVATEICRNLGWNPNQPAKDL